MFEHDLNFFFLTYERMLQSKKNIGPSYTEVRTIFRKRTIFTFVFYVYLGNTPILISFTFSLKPQYFCLLEFFSLSRI